MSHFRPFDRNPGNSDVLKLFCSRRRRRLLAFSLLRKPQLQDSPSQRALAGNKKTQVESSLCFLFFLSGDNTFESKREREKIGLYTDRGGTAASSSVVRRTSGKRSRVKRRRRRKRTIGRRRRRRRGRERQFRNIEGHGQMVPLF